ncbi:MAG: class I tRNA ligase family protein, partial [Mycobacterium leprae]
MTDSFYITTAIYYANGPLHIGHCYESVAADVLARYHRAWGEAVHFLTGTDEHGLKIERKAQTLGRAPQDWVDEISGSVRTLFDALRIS